MIIMDKKVVIYIPTAFTAAIRKTAIELSTRFGGATITKNDRVGIDANKRLILEPITTLTSWYNSKAETTSVLSVMLGLAANLRNDLEEDCIAVEVEGQVLLV